jgi:hypothetical protein
MKKQLSQQYSVDSRYRGMERAVDNTAGKAFALSFIKRRNAAKEALNPADKSMDGRFTVSGPGDGLYSFRNAFRPSK